MSASLTLSNNDTSSSTQLKQRWPNWLREPLLHFFVLGALLFIADQAMLDRTDDPRSIVVNQAVDNEATTVFEQSRGRKPNSEELKALHRVWLDNEVLYREGLALQLDKGDTAIRERVIFKALSVIDAGIKLPPIDDTMLRNWFESHRDKYDEPARYTFQEAVQAGENSEAAVRSFVAMLNSGKPGDASAGLRVFKDRPYGNLVQSYGAGFPKLLEAEPTGEWRALQTRDGWRAIRVDSLATPKPAVFETLRGVVLQDWKDATAAEMRTAAVRALTEKYRVKFVTPERAGH